MSEYAFPSLGVPSNVSYSGASPHTAGYGPGYHTSPVYTQSHGMTLRDYFAGQALAGILANNTANHPGWNAERAYAHADAMLKERGGG